MRDPDTRIDPIVEWAIEKTREFLEPRVNYGDWEGDPERKVALQDTLMEIENNGSLSEGAKVIVRKVMVDAMKKNVMASHPGVFAISALPRRRAASRTWATIRRAMTR